MRISTIIPAYNRAELIGQTIESVLGQDRPPAEVIVVDDGSTDGTVAALGRFGAAVRIVRQANAGAGAARNAGFAAATGEIVHFMDSDDAITDDFYARSAAAIENGAEMTYCAWLKTAIAGRSLSPEPLAIQQGPVPRPSALDALALALEWVSLLQACLLRRALVVRAGPYRTDLKPSEDSEFLYRVLAAAGRVDHVAGPLLLYREHPGSVSLQNLPARMADRVALWTVLDAHRAGRTDLPAGFARRFRRKKLAVAQAAARFAGERAQALAADASLVDRAAAPVERVAHRLAARWRVETAGNPYPPVFAAAPLSDAQQAAIARLGFELGQ